MDYDLNVLEQGCEELGITLNEVQKQQFITFYEYLVEKNKVMNLTGITEFQEVLVKHFLDSLACVKAVDMNKINRIMDIGTGAGFPGRSAQNRISASGSLPSGFPEKACEFSGGNICTSEA